MDEYNIYEVTIYCWDTYLEKGTNKKIKLETFAEDWEGISPSEWDYINLMAENQLNEDEEICDAIDPDVTFIRTSRQLPF